MKTERSEQLKICQTCTNRKMDFSRGLLCGLTEEFADFEDNCEQFVADEDLKKNHEEKLNNILIQTNNPHFFYWEKLGWFSLWSIIVFIISYFISVHDFHIYLESELKIYTTSNYSLFFQKALFPVILWFFIGWEVKKVKNGLASGIVYSLTFLSINQFFPELLNIYVYTIPTLLAGIVFVSFNCTKLHKKWLFPLAAVCLHIGLISFSFIDVREINDTINFLLSVLDFERESTEFLSLTIERENGANTLSLNHLIFNCFKNTTIFMFSTFVLKTLKHRFKLNLRTISTLALLNPRLLPLIIFFLYSLIIIFSTSIVYVIYHINERLIGLSNRRILIDLKTSFIVLGCVILIWAIAIHLYRKITLEYYLKTNSSVSWMYYFSCVPVINIVFWIVALLALKLNKNVSKQQQLNWLNSSNNSFTIFYFILLSLYYSLKFILGNSSGLLKFELIISFTIILFYIFHKSGIHYLIMTKLIVICLLIYASVIDYNRMQIYESALYWSFLQIALLYLYYPIFHLKEFKIEVPLVDDKIPS